MAKSPLYLTLFMKTISKDPICGKVTKFPCAFLSIFQLFHSEI